MNESMGHLNKTLPALKSTSVDGLLAAKYRKIMLTLVFLG